MEETPEAPGAGEGAAPEPAAAPQEPAPEPEAPTDSDAAPGPEDAQPPPDPDAGPPADAELGGPGASEAADSGPGPTEEGAREAAEDAAREAAEDGARETAEEEPKEVSERSRPRPPGRGPADAASRRTSKFRRSTSGVQSLQETLKEKQARFKEAREGRKMKVNAAYKYIFEILSDRLGLDIVTVEELILDGPTLQAFDSFLVKGGSRTLKFIYQEGEAPGLGKC
ncbi:uncharacterized protein LOC144327161 [Podarcis muralis]